ncbi:MAG: hypothetical protein NC117_05915 [Pseudoflavonifractor sp.]|nr:hypothetical protein [Pseudoflavonifractor sp.]
MKKTLLLSVLCGGLMLASCSDNNEPDGVEVDAKDIDYTAANAASWGNYMVQVAGLLKNDAASLYDAWATSYNGGRSYADIFKSHNGEGYESAAGCIEEIIDGCIDIASEVGSQKIGEPYRLYTGGKPTEALYAVESWYSWHSREDYANNIYSIRNSYLGSTDGTLATNSISSYVASVDAALDAEVKGAINAAAAAILAIPQPFRNNINSPEARAAMDACSDLETILDQKLKPLFTPAPASAASRLDAIVANYVDVIVLPTYRSLKEKNAALYDATVAFRSAPSDNAFAAACNAWLVAREPWERSEAFLFGPVDALGFDPNMDSWPLDQEQIVQILNSGNFNDLNWTDGDADDKIEAAQSLRGFHTLEFLIFKDGQARRVQN